MQLSSLYRYFSENLRLIFLVDGLGALLSTLMLLLIVQYEEVFGMPKETAYRLMLVTTLFAAYSLGTFLLNPKAWKSFLILIAIANILYAALNLALLIWYRNRLTTFGTAYFLAEILIIVLLSKVELGVIKKTVLFRKTDSSPE